MKIISVMVALFITGCATVSEREEAIERFEEVREAVNAFCNIPSGVRAEILPVELREYFDGESVDDVCQRVGELR